MVWINQQIIDINGKERSIQSARVIKHKRMDIVAGEVVVRYVEVLIIGKTRKWKEWYPLLEFMEQNPKVKMDG